MYRQGILFVIACIFQVHTTVALWSCTSNVDCSSVSGSICVEGDCMCPTGQQVALGGTACVDLAPYHASACVEDQQCSRLFATFECRRQNETDDVGSCACQPNNHYFLGRCWPTIDYGEPCTRDEQCLSVLRDMYSLVCNGTCVCADGYYERQRGECRKIANAVGEGCVLNEDCQFPGGACDIGTLTCYNENIGLSKETRQAVQEPQATPEFSLGTRQHGVACGISSPCEAPFECSVFGACICPVGYYISTDGRSCLAELGSPSTQAQCVGLLAVVRDGICTCPPNFYFDENMRDCIRVTRRITDSCVTDSNCHTFGSAAVCGPPQEPWFLRTCECITELAVWDANRDMCRLFAGIGESCLVDSDCLAGELEIQCVLNEEGEGQCTCPDGYVASGGLCLTTGLELGDACQATVECTGTVNTVCEGGRCSCDSSGYQEIDGVCAPIIGGMCEQDTDCVIENTVCVNATGVMRCQCSPEHVAYDNGCWPVVSGIEGECEVNAQCEETLGTTSMCQDGHCVCIPGHHFRDSRCWPVTGLFEGCASSSQCYLPTDAFRVVCRNSLCQCDFDFPFSEELGTCAGNHSSASRIFSNILLIAATFAYMFLS